MAAKKFLPLLFFRVWWRESCPNWWNLGVCRCPQVHRKDLSSCFRLRQVNFWMNVNIIASEGSVFPIPWGWWPVLLSYTQHHPQVKKNSSRSTCMRAKTLRTDDCCLCNLETRLTWMHPVTVSLWLCVLWLIFDGVSGNSSLCHAL